MKIATWNVNSIKARLPNLLDWLKSAEPDVVLLQEIKTVDDTFPSLEIEELGYACAVHGQKSYNGVAILSRVGLDDVQAGLPGDDGDDQARYIEATVGSALGPEAKRVRVATIYLPNGNPAPGPKYDYKLAWMKRLKARAEQLIGQDMPVVLGGDYNVIPANEDVHDPVAWEGDALIRPETRAAFREILWLGYTDAFRALHSAPHRYSFWDYQGGAWENDYGIRIDHLLLSPQATDLLRESEIDSKPRGKERPSDHTPVWCTLETIKQKTDKPE